MDWRRTTSAFGPKWPLQPWEGWLTVCGWLGKKAFHMEMHMVEWKPLPTPMWPEGSVMADLPGLILEASFDQGVPTWKVQRHKGENALPELVSSGTADSFEAA